MQGSKLQGLVMSSSMHSSRRNSHFASQSSDHPLGIQTASVEADVMRLFGSNDLGRAGLELGWAEPEEAHNWSDGCETVLSIVVSDLAKGAIVEFAGEPFLNEKCKRQDVILHVNGFHVGRWRLTQPGHCELSAKLEPEQLFRRDGGVLVRCTWSFPDSINPALLGLGEDSRELGFCFRSITIKNR